MQIQQHTLSEVPQLRPLRVAGLCVGVALVSLLIPMVKHVEIYAIATGIFALVAWPIWWRWQQGRFDAFEPIHLLGALYFAFYGLGAIWSITDPKHMLLDKFLFDYIAPASFYCLLGIAAMTLGYLGPWFKRQVPRTHVQYTTGVFAVLVPGVIGFMGWLSMSQFSRGLLAGRASAVLSVLAQLTPLFMFAWALAWLIVLSGKATTTQRLALFGAMFPMAIISVAVRLNSKSLTIFLVGTPIIALWYTRRKLPWTTLVILLLILVFVIFPFYNTFRDFDTRIPFVTRMELTTNLIRGWDLDHYLNRSFISAKYRMATMLGSVAVVVRDTGRWVPYAKGETIFMPFIQFFIPRVLWPDKPLFLLGREFGAKFRVIHILDDTTSTAATVPGELYWNFDLPGIIIGMWFFGFTVRLFYRRYGESDEAEPFRKAIHIVLLIQFTWFDGGLAANYVTVIRTLLILEGFCYIGREIGFIKTRPAASLTAEAQS